MPARKEPQDYRALARARGLVWLGAEAPGTQRLTTWRCRAAGHVFERTYNRIQATERCPFCVGRVRKTPADYHALAARHGLTWLGPEVGTTRMTTRWRCAQGHVFAARYSTIQQESGCPACGGHAPKAEADYIALGRAQGLVWHGRRAGSTRIKTDWQCAAGHVFRATFNTVQAGHGCPRCAGNAPRTAADYRRIGRAHRLTWLGPLPARTSQPTRWRCRAGHVWTTLLNTVARGHRCPHCQGRARKTAADYRALARARRFRWLGKTLPRTTKVKTRWACSLEHAWSQTYHQIQGGSGCPTCARLDPAGLRAAKRSLKRAAERAREERGE